MRIKRTRHWPLANSRPLTEPTQASNPVANYLRISAQVDSRSRRTGPSKIGASSGCGISNGKLLDRAEAAGFDLVIAANKNLPHQQNLTKRRIAILELWTNHRPTLEQDFVGIRDRVQSAMSGRYIVLKREGE